MGIYYNNFIYYGIIITNEQYDQLRKNPQYQINESIYDCFFRRYGSHYILHIPESYYNFANIDPMFESYEIEQGYVYFKDVQKCLRRRIGEKSANTLFHLPIHRKNIFDKLVSLSDNRELVGFKMSQSVCTTLSLPLDDTRLEHTLLIKLADPEFNQTYRHYKNEKLYVIVGIGHHTETLDKLVIYRALYDDPTYGQNAILVRPYQMFKEMVEYGGYLVPRFTLIVN